MNNGRASYQIKKRTSGHYPGQDRKEREGGWTRVAVSLFPLSSGEPNFRLSRNRELATVTFVDDILLQDVQKSDFLSTSVEVNEPFVPNMDIGILHCKM